MIIVRSETNKLINYIESFIMKKVEHWDFGIDLSCCFESEKVNFDGEMWISWAWKVMVIHFIRLIKKNIFNCSTYFFKAPLIIFLNQFEIQPLKLIG